MFINEWNFKYEKIKLKKKTLILNAEREREKKFNIREKNKKIRTTNIILDIIFFYS